jgi:membrane associated rhomboid family serine protease
MAAIVIFGAIVITSLVGFSAPRFIELNLFRPFWFVQRRQYWSAISSGFIHADMTHLLFNAISYGFFAFPLQRVIGPAHFAALYFTGLLLSNVGTYFKPRRDPNYACLGASGAILAVLFASIVYFPRNSITIFPIPIGIPAPLFAICYLIFTFYAARQARGRVNHEAHFDGALAGLAFVTITDPSAWPRAWHLVLG